MPMDEHSIAKEKIAKKLEKWYDISVPEYAIGDRWIDGISISDLK